MMSEADEEQGPSPETGLTRAQEALTEASKILDAAGLSFFLAVTTPAKIVVQTGEEQVVPLALGSVNSKPTQGLNLLDATWMAMGQYFATAYEGVLSPEVLVAAIEAGIPKVELSREIYSQTQAGAHEVLRQMMSSGGAVN